MIGEVIGHFHIDDKIGEGQFGIVYKSQDIRLNRTVAFKVLKERYLHSDSTWDRLLHEARVASALNHPNICRVYEIGEEQGVNYIALEFVEGRTLREMLDSGPLPVRTAFCLAIQIAEAMAYMHEAGILNWDLKTSNIMVTPADRIKIIDFGLTNLMEQERTKKEQGSYPSAQEVGWTIGTLPYMPPELLRGEEPTAQSRIWSLGVVLFEMLTGELPFSGRSPFELGTHIMTEPVKKLPIELPAGLRGIVHRCMARDNSRRYHSAVEVLNHLQSELVGYQIRAILANRPSSQDHQYGRNWWRSALSHRWLQVRHVSTADPGVTNP